MSPADLFTKSKAAQYVGVSRNAVSKRIAAGKLAITPVNGSDLIARRELTKWKKERVKEARRLMTAGAA